LFSVNTSALFFFPLSFFSKVRQKMSQSDYYEEVVVPQQQQQPYIVGTTTTKTSSSHRHGHHHDEDDHHHRHHHHKSDGDAAAIGWATWCCVISFSAFILIFVIIAIVASAQSNNVEHHMHQQFTHWQTTMDAQQEQEDTLATKMVTMSALDGTPGQRRLMLCARQSYYSKKGEQVLLAKENELHVLEQSIEELREGEMKDFYYYHVSAHMKLSLTSSLMAKHQKSYLTIDYNITSSFGRVSTVRLEELEFNTLDQSLGAMRSIVLCTNNPFLDVQRCDASLTKRNILTLHGQESVPLVIALQKEKKQQQKNVASGGGTTTTGRDAIIHEEQTVDLLDAEEDDDEEVSSSPHKDKQRREVIGQRMYNIVFYQNEGTDSYTAATTASRKNKTHGTGSLDNADSYKEKRILTLEPIQC